MSESDHTDVTPQPGTPSSIGSRLLDWFSERLNLAELFSILTSFGLFYSEVDTRKPFREALAEALDKPSPSYARGLRVLGLLVVGLLALEGVTGMLLSLYYLPTTESAHASLGTIMRDVQFGGLVHQVHFWGAQLLIVVLIVRLLRFFVQRVYQPPRELFWVLATLLLLVVFHIDMTGRILPWTANAYWSGIRTLEIIQAVPIYGTAWTFLLGVEDVVLSDLYLIRAYILHVMVLPGFALVLVYLHFSAVRRVGLTEVQGEVRRVGKNLFGRHVLNLAILLVLLLGVLVSLAILTPTTYEPAADPYSTAPGVGPAWYLLATFGFLELVSFLPRQLAGLVIFAGFTAFVVVPFIIRLAGKPAPATAEMTETPRPGSNTLALVIGLVVFAVWIALTIYGAQVV